MAFSDYYVDVSLGADGAGTSDDPFRWSQVVSRMTGSGAAAGDRYYIRGTGTNLGTLVSSVDATVLNPIVFVGCYMVDTTWTPCSTAGRSGNGYGNLDVTNYPSLTFAANGVMDLGASDYCWVEGLNISVSGSAGYGLRIGQSGIAYRCNVASSRNDSTAEGITAYGANCSIVECDGEMTGASCRAVIYASGVDVLIYGCRVKGTGATAGDGIRCNQGGVCIAFNQIYNVKDRAISQVSSTTTNAYIALCNTIYNCGEGLGQADYAYARAFRAINNMITDCGGDAIGGLSTSDLVGHFLFNRTRDNTDGAFDSGIWNDWETLATGHITTDTGGATTDYANPTASPPDLRLIAASPGKAAGIPKNTDIGACQRAEPTLPGVEDVQSGVQYGEGGTGSTGTFAVPAEGDVEEGVQYGAGGTEYTGTLDVNGSSGPASGGGMPVLGGSVVR